METLSVLPLVSAASAGVDFGVLGLGTHDSNGLAPARLGLQSGPARRTEIDYCPELPTADLIAEVRRLLAAGRRTERLVCRYLADLADRVQARQDAALGPYADELEAVRSFFGLGARETRERVRIGRALRHLPQIEAALLRGQLSYSRARELTRVATAQTELDWLEVATRLDMRALERRVTASRAAAAATFDPQADVLQRAHLRGMRRVTLQLSNEAWELLERAMEAARRATAAELSVGEALAAVARAALSVQGEARPPACVGSAMSNGCSATPKDGDRNTGDREHDTGTSENGCDCLTLAALPCSEAVRDAPSLEREAPAAQPGSPVGFETPAAQPGSPVGFETPPTQGGSADGLGPVSDKGPVQPGAARRLLAVMGCRQRWTLDALTEMTGLLAQEVSVAMLGLELDGLVRWRDCGYEPT